MGKAHVYGFATAEKVFDLPVRFDMDLIADANLPLAEAARQGFGFKRATANWRDLINDPDIGLVDIPRPMLCTKKWHWPRLPRESMSIVKNRLRLWPRMRWK